MKEAMFAQEQVWKTERLGKFTASEFHRLMKGGTRPMTEDELKEAKANKSKRTTVDTLFGDGAITFINEVIAEILTGEAAEDFEVNATKWGQANEWDGIIEFQERTGLEVIYYGVSNPKFFPFGTLGGGSPDGEVPSEDAIVEMKCPYVSANHVAYLRAAKEQADIVAWFKDAHFDYYTQIQKNMLAAKRSKCYFISYDPRMVGNNNKILAFVIPQDLPFQDDIKYRLDAATEIVNNVVNDLVDTTPEYTPLHLASTHDTLNR